MNIGVEIYVRGPDGEPTTTANASVLCGYCNSALSRQKFYKNNPNAVPGWGRQRAAERAALGLPKRKPGKRRPVEIAMIVDAIDSAMERKRSRRDFVEDES